MYSRANADGILERMGNYMEKEQQRIMLRQRKLGILLYDARLAAGASTDTCARLMGVSPEEYTRFEDGMDSPSLPQVETFAYGLNIPLSHFTGNQALSTNAPRADDVKLDLIRTLRQKMIGARIMQERGRLNLTTADIALVAGLSEEELVNAEAGNVPISFPRLQLIADLLDIPIDSLYDQQGIIGQWRKQQERDTTFADLSPDLQDFICNPLNLPYLDLAVHLSEMDAQKLRSIAESILEITY